MTGASFKSWGEVVFIKVAPDPAGTSISVTSKAHSQLVTWGKNAENEKNFLDELTRGVLKLHLREKLKK
jgi:hypothetical protein